MRRRRTGRRVGMDLSRLSSVYDVPGPFATAYLDTSRDSENAAHEIELRWRAARQELEEQGAPASALDAMAAAIGEDRGVPGRHGRCRGRRRRHRPRPRHAESAAPRDRAVRSAPPPHAAHRAGGRVVPHVVVVADRVGAEVRVVAPGAEDDHEVRGNDFDIHKVRPAGGRTRSTSNPPRTRGRRTRSWSRRT